MDFPTYSELRILTTYLFAHDSTCYNTCNYHNCEHINATVGAFQQVTGPVIININPGETKSFSWGLIAGNNETSMLKIYADGNGSEFL